MVSFCSRFGKEAFDLIPRYGHEKGVHTPTVFRQKEILRISNFGLKSQSL